MAGTPSGNVEYGAFGPQTLDALLEDELGLQMADLDEMLRDGEITPEEHDRAAGMASDAEAEGRWLLEANGIRGMTLNDALLELGAIGIKRVGEAPREEAPDGPTDLEREAGMRLVEASDEQAIYEVTCEGALDWARRPWLEPGTHLLVVDRGPASADHPRGMRGYASDGRRVGVTREHEGRMRLVGYATRLLADTMHQCLRANTCEPPVAAVVTEFSEDDTLTVELRYGDACEGMPARTDDSRGLVHFRVPKGGRRPEDALEEVLGLYGAKPERNPGPGDWYTPYGYNVPAREAFVRVVPALAKDVAEAAAPGAAQVMGAAAKSPSLGTAEERHARRAEARTRLHGRGAQ